MRKKLLMESFLVIVFSFLMLSSVVAESKKETTYIQVIVKTVNIRTRPTTKSVIVVKARKGDVFELKGEKRNWCKITMFSGEYRYIYKKLTKKIKYNVNLPKSESTRKAIYKDTGEAENRAQEDADKKYPVSTRYGHSIDENINKNIDYMRLLNDRYKLRIIHNYGVKTPDYDEIVLEGMKKGWGF